LVRYSTAAETALTSAGWTPGRRVPLDKWLEPLIAERYAPTPVALELLANLGGLVIHLPAAPPRNPYSHDLVFDPIHYGSGERDRVEEWEAALGVGLFPLGHVTQAYPLWVAGSGAVYYGFEFGLYSLGGSFAEALDRLLAADIGPVAVAEPSGAPDGGA
jgi:hypothetical protein